MVAAIDGSQRSSRNTRSVSPVGETYDPADMDARTVCSAASAPPAPSSRSRAAHIHWLRTLVEVGTPVVAVEGEAR